MRVFDSTATATHTSRRDVSSEFINTAFDKIQFTEDLKEMAVKTL